MSDYDLQNSDEARRRAMDFSSERSGHGRWVVIGLVALVALIAILAIGSGGSGDGTATAPTGSEGTVAPAEETAPTAAGTETN